MSVGGIQIIWLFVRDMKGKTGAFSKTIVFVFEMTLQYW